MSNGDSPNDLMDRRDLLIDQLSQYGQVSVEQLEGGSTNVSFVDGTSGTAYPIVSDQTADWAGPPAGGWSPGGQMGGLLTIGKRRAARSTATSPRSTRSPARSPPRSTAPTAAPSSPPAPPRAPRIAVSAPIQAAPASIVSGTGAAGSNDLALAVSQLRGNAAIDGVYKAFVAKVGGDLNESTRMQANAQVLADSVEDRRQSVAGVSMDEEMSNLVRFQRAYQASARAMSTMDEMLDVLINRTGRVGL